MPRMGMIARGNLVAVVQVETPQDLNPKQLLEIAAMVSSRSLAGDDVTNPFEDDAK